MKPFCKNISSFLYSEFRKIQDGRIILWHYKNVYSENQIQFVGIV